uniref:Cadherin n=1 Tax=Macrostomum lignano TaxID=282301 RepID=A0A1I8FSP4_9PLAT
NEFSIYQDSLSQKVDVLVLINDINDEQPSWPVAGNVIRVEFLDGDGPGKNKFILNAVDKDLGKNGRVRYKLNNLGAPFSLKQTAEDNRLSLETSRIIDREEKDSYNMSLVAIDEGNPPLTGSIMLQVIIIDVNDHAPEFDRAFYTPPKPIYENEVVNSEVLQLQATDRDSGDYGTYLAVLANGRIIIRKPLDYDRMTKKYFLFEVIARDNARDKEYRKTATATVSISVLDRVDEAPTIETCFLPSGCTASPSAPSIPENLALRSKIAEVIVRDLDTGDHVQCETVLSDNQPPSHLQVGGLSEHGQEVPFILLSSSVNYGSSAPTDSTMKLFDLVTNRVFDREVSSRACFGIVCRDSQRLEGRASYCVTIEDVNDSPPVVDGPIVFQALEEDAERRPLQGRVRNHVHDADIGNNSRLQFALDPTDLEAARLFEVNADTGQLRPLVVFDRERQASYTLRVLVTDGGKSPLTATATVTVRVWSTQTTVSRCAGRQSTDCGRQHGRLRRSRGRGREGAGQRRGRLPAGRRDGDADWRAFSVDRRTGEIKTSMPLDRERQAHYSFRVLAEDQPRSGHGALTGTCLVSVTVEDENDNRPVFRLTPNHPEVFQMRRAIAGAELSVGPIDPIGAENFTATLPSPKPPTPTPCRSRSGEPGISIGQVLAEDPDEGDNRLVDYELLNRAEVHDLFSVDRRSGLVLINKALHSQPARDFILVLRACDRGRPRNCSAEARYRAHISGSPGGGGDSGEHSGGKGLGNEIVIVCLAVMFLVLGIATVTVVCLIVRKRSVYIKKSRQPAVAMTTGPGVQSREA